MRKPEINRHGEAVVPLSCRFPMSDLRYIQEHMANGEPIGRVIVSMIREIVRDDKAMHE